MSGDLSDEPVSDEPSEEQRAAALYRSNVLNLKRYQIKRLALDLGRLEGRTVRTVALICEERRRHG